jgi:hypothetical protein
MKPRISDRRGFRIGKLLIQIRIIRADPRNPRFSSFLMSIDAMLQNVERCHRGDGCMGDLTTKA